MKRLGGIWPTLRSFANLLAAFKAARRRKGPKPAIARFALDLETALLALQRSLDEGSYTPDGYRVFTIYEKKPRRIAAASFRDRVIHHAVMRLIEPSLDRRFIAHSYACRRGKGVHRAVHRYARWCERYPYALKLDVAQYFASIDHRRLNEKLRRRIKDPKALALLGVIISHSPSPEGRRPYFCGDDLLTPLERRVGIPIGNLTSQFFANLYLDDLDHYLPLSPGHLAGQSVFALCR